MRARSRALAPSHVLLCAMVIFIVYGSIFPFNFEFAERPAAELLLQWNPFLDRADAIDNILLFVPLGLALYFSFASLAARGLAGLLAWLILGLGLQWAQLFLPGRVASWSDAINNAIGLFIGLSAARLLAPWLTRQQTRELPLDRFALLLVGAWYTYESFPFLPTLDVGLLRGHIKSVVGPMDFDALRLTRHAVSAMLGTMLLLQANVLQRRWASIGSATAVLLFSELFVPYGDLHVETLVGIIIGMLVGERLDRWLNGMTHRIVFLLAIVGIAMTVVTPMRGQPSGGTFTFTPFSGLLWHGTTSGIPPTAFEALAIGALLWSGLSTPPPASTLSRYWPWVVLALLVVAESVRVGVVGYRGDTTPLFIWAMLAPVAIMLKRPQPVSQPAPPARPQATVSQARQWRIGQPKRTVLKAGIGWLGLAIGLWLVLRLPTVPYNLRELFGSNDLLGTALFALALMWLGYGPWWIATTAARQRASALWLPVLLAAASTISLLLLKFSVTQESLDDITGSTDLYRRITEDGLWGVQWSEQMSAMPAAPVGALERAIRYGALYSLLQVPLTLVAMQMCGLWQPPQRFAGFVVAVCCWWLAKIVVIDWAITDNLVELIAPGGVPYLALLLLLIAANTAAWVAGASERRIVAASGITALLLPAAWWLLRQGLEPVLIKYGHVFSATQFLLGQSRSSQLSDWQLFLRWCALYLAAVGVVAWGMRLARLVQRRRTA